MRLKTGRERVLVIPDIQIPYEHPDALRFVRAVGSFMDCTTAVCVGDEVDQYALSHYDHDPEADAAGPELTRTRNHLLGWFDEFPDLRICTSNHTQRVYKKALKAGIPERYLREIRDWMEAPAGWRWADAFVIDGVRYEHGDANNSMHAARNLAIRNRRSTVIGHHHSHAGVHYVANDEDMIWGLNVGCLIDVRSVAFAYSKHSANRPTLGCGVVIYGAPYFVPMPTDKKGRWTGELCL
jgi:hypothetical protein